MTRQAAVNSLTVFVLRSFAPSQSCISQRALLQFYDIWLAGSWYQSRAKTTTLITNNYCRVLNCGKFFEIKVHILPAFTEIERNNCVAHTHEIISSTLDLNAAICRRKPFKIDLIDISKHLTSAILFCLDRALLTPCGGNNAQFFPDSEPMRLLH